MALWKYLLIFAVALVSPAFQVYAGDREQFIGMWQETHPRDHIVVFAEDGSWKLHLKKGELSDLHSLGGTWRFLPDGRVQVSLTLNGNTKAFTSRLKFDGEEMVLVDPDGTETRHRRHKGPIPERFQW